MTPPRDELVGRLVDERYRILSHLADGGMGSVYVALDERLDRNVALKIMRPDLARDAAFVERFRREARAAASLGHPNIVAVYDQGQDGDLVFLVMEYVQGSTLRSRLDAHGALTPREALRLQRQILQALAAAHSGGIVHRDVKPENVLLGTNGAVKVADFGLARAVAQVSTTTVGAAAFGTVCYLSPEQVELGESDARSDVYAAALVLFEMLTGRRAVDGDTPIQVAYRHVHGQIAPPSTLRPGLAPALDALIAGASRRDREERPKDAGAFLAELERVAAGLSPAELDLKPPGVVNPAGPEHTDRLISATRPVPVLATGVAGAAGARGAGDAGRAAAVGDAGGADAPPPAPAPPHHHESGAAEDPEGSSGGGLLAGTRRRVVAALVAALVLVGGGTGWYQFFGPGSARIVPKLAGLAQDDAVAALSARDLRADIRPEFSDDVKPGLVISADPGEGATARRATAVALAVSRGPDLVTVPEVAGRSEEAATAALRDARLRVGGRTEDFSETVAAGQVISTAPKIGSSTKAGTAVAYVVSKGRKPFEVVDWTGKPYADISEAVKAAGLAAKITEEFSGTVPKGVIMAQDPVKGTLYKGDAISFTVSKGPDLVAVPEVAGMTEKDATAELTKAGFTVRVDRVLGGFFGTARLTDPPAGSKAPRGSTVTLRVV